MKKLLVLLGWYCCVSAWSTSYEILPNGGMEELDAGMPKGWFMLFRQQQLLSLANQAHRGEHALQVTTGKKVKPDTVIVFSGTDSGGRGGYPCVAGGIYRLKATIRSNHFAQVKLYANIRDGGGGFLGGLMSPVMKTVDEWREYSWKIQVPENEVRKIGVGVIILTPDNQVLIDSVSLTYDTEENKGRPDIYRQMPPPVLHLDLVAENHELLLDGKPGRRLEEGLHSLLVKTDGKRKLRFASSHCPQLIRRWRVKEGWHPEAARVEYDDSAWTLAQVDKDGTVILPTSGTHTLRQVLLWQANQHGSWKCLLGTTRQLALPQGSVENFFVALYSPLPRTMMSPQLVWEIPAGFRLLNLLEKPIRNNRSIHPLGMRQESMPGGGVRYVLDYPDLKCTESRYSLVPMAVPENLSGTPVLRYYRLGNGNFTELPVSMPVKVLPPIPQVGRTAFSLEGYEDGSFTPLSVEHARLHFRQCGRMGVNRHFMEPESTEQWRYFLEEVPHGNLVYAVAGSFPMTVKLWGRRTEALGKLLAWVKRTPDAQVKLYGEPGRFDYQRNIPKNLHYGAFCPTYVNGRGKADYQAAIRKIMQEEQLKFPRLNRVFIDWEFSPLRQQQQGLWCFCPACREAFARTMGLQVLPDEEEIVAKHAEAWKAFRLGQDARTVQTIAKALKPLGMDVLYYSQESMSPLWRLQGSISEIFATLPGNSPATRFRQRYVDQQMSSLCQGSGVPLMVAQRFARLGPSRAPDGWKSMTLCSTDGQWQDLELWKIQVVRMLASCRGGFDLQNTLYYPVGSLYYMSLGLMAVKPYEEIIRQGVRVDSLLSGKHGSYPDGMAIRHGGRVLVLLFNETEHPRNVRLEVFGYGKGSMIRQDGREQVLEDDQLDIEVPPMDASIFLLTKNNQKRRAK